MQNNQLEDLSIRFAGKEDVGIILKFIKDLADYENLSPMVVATEELLEEILFNQKKAEVIIAEYQQLPVAFALFFHNYSTFLGRSGIYLEDLYVASEMRGKGIGSRMLSFLAKLALERKCGRLEWACLDWNKPSIEFYKQLGGAPQEDWTVYRVNDKTLLNLANKYDNVE